MLIDSQALLKVLKKLNCFKNVSRIKLQLNENLREKENSHQEINAKNHLDLISPIFGWARQIFTFDSIKVFS